MEFEQDTEREYEIDPILLENASKIIDDYLTESNKPRFEDVLSQISQENDFSDTEPRVKEIITSRIKEIYERKLSER